MDAVSLLRRIEKENQVYIWMAAETGSHSFGLQTPESDCDIRFIFMQKNIREYLSLKPKREIITFKNQDYEIEGWDLFKAFRLMQKNNPGLFEWFYSRTFDLTNHEFVNKIRALMQTCYSKRTLGLHYFNMSRNNLVFTGHITDEGKKANKTMVQAARCYLMVCYILQKKTLPPLGVDQLLAETTFPSPVRLAIEKLFRSKKMNRYLPGNFLVETSVLLEAELDAIKSILPDLPEGNEMEEEMNRIIWNCLGI
ncbi:DNA polymerase beta superfamily protein [Bacillus sp. V5-8f]|uniref:nucleotidyltransferase domain-containing protein n=1 Tax=Bacillus sp. V5-8f TaxID=2053044 RepID=UPI000C760FAB|nr:nucleotidyltransferase domain-containing protein [Bacillus sp. V5-8f]PLT34925.1 hypothetical protein CUU64_05900 [Bacillus sp. V5-8f]